MDCIVRKKSAMVNRVNGNDYYDYTKLSLPTSADTTGSGEKFSLDYQRTDDKKEEEEDKEKISREDIGKGIAGNGARTVMQSGVKLELSGKSREKDSAGKAGSFSDLLDTVRSWIITFLQSFKGILNRIWNDPEPEEEVLSAKEVPLEETDRLSEEYLRMNPPEDWNTDHSNSQSHGEGAALASESADGPGHDNPGTPSKTTESGEQYLSGGRNREKEIQQYLRSGNLEQVISLLTEDGHRTMAKNSTLLTYYDRTGRLTTLSASDQERILHGDRNTRKL